MPRRTFAETLQELRKGMKFTQKEFAEFLSLPQASISAYENGRNSPTMEALVNIAQKCKVSVDWLCGLADTKYNFSSLGEVIEFVCLLLELNELGVKIEVNDHLPDDVETEADKYYACIKVYGCDRNYRYNEAFCLIMRQIRDNYADLESYQITKEVYNILKEKLIQDYDAPITQKEYPELSRYELLLKRAEHAGFIKPKKD